jgi:5-formyltetrahydrofolate cyclo-ligase
MTKSELRAVLRRRRAAFVTARGSAILNSDILLECLSKILTNNVKVISTYRAIGSETDVMAAVFHALPPDVALALPCANSKEEMLIFRQWHMGDPITESPIGFEQPLDSAPPLSPDIILTPLLGFDRSLNRIGQGAGHYDRAFDTFPDALRIGIAWSVQEVDAIPLDVWDVPLDAVITEKEWISAPHSRIIKS